ncbi:hypothetical protein DICVIV_10471 [Dictyocaulus viviparus]|uniref:Uncharacterized protein n=1 Tax=Dictyocaulus viviparus TaxID=29172 RepID=A0A0D8XIA8_DICVI|nr:hypothetical protein DICVIV_10471 [Dictyocaulus viviparus]
MSKGLHMITDETAAHWAGREAICQLADGMDDDSKTSTPSLPARHSTSPASSRPGCVGGGGPGSGVPQLSPLETARLKMTLISRERKLVPDADLEKQGSIIHHSVGAAAAVGLASAAPDVFEFADDRSVGSGSAYPSPSPQFTPFGYGTVESPLSGQPIRGVATKRRPRARKTANMGDRLGDFSATMLKSPSLSGVSTRKPRGKTGVRRPRGSRKAALAVTHVDLDMQSRAPPPLQRSYSDYEQMSNPGLVGMSTSPYVDTESDDECDPPPPPKSLAMFQSPSTSHTVSASSVANSPSRSMSPLHVASSTPSLSATHPPQSPLASASPLINQSAPVPSPRTVQPRKTSLDAVVGRLKTSLPQQSTPPTKRSIFNDLYDDGTESSPPPEERVSLASAISSTCSTSVNASPLQSSTTAAHTNASSPRAPELTREQTASCEVPQSITPTVNIEGGSKLILKIPKVPSRASPSVDAQKLKSIPMQSMPKLEKQEKKREKERKEGHKNSSGFFLQERSKDKSDETRKQKRKAEGKEKEREHKKHKTSSTPSQYDANSTSTSSSANSSVKSTPGAPLPFGFVGSLKNFKIPKREEVKENGKEKETLPPAPTRPMPPIPPTLPVAMPNPPPLPLKSAIPKKTTIPIPPPPMIPMPRQPLLSTPPSVPLIGPPPLGIGPRKPPTLPDHRDRRSMIGVPPFRGNTSSIPLPKGPPPPQATPSAVGGTWIRPPSHIPTQNIRSPSPDPNAMQIDDDLNSPEDSLRIADD